MEIYKPVKQPDETAWKALSYFNLYRFLIAFLFVALYWIGQLPQPLGIYNKLLFGITANVYLGISIAAMFFIQLQKPRYRLQVIAQILIDILIITVLMYSSAGLNSGFGMLLVIAVAGGGLLSPGRLSILFAAIATICVLGHEVYVQLNVEFPSPNYTHAGFLGITFFITAFISQTLASRVQESEALAEQRAVDLKNLAKLNEHIVQRMQSGIIVLDNNLKIHLLNESARKLLNIDKDLQLDSIETVLPELASHIKYWMNDNDERVVIIKSIKSGVDIQASFSRLSLEKKFEILVFLDDVSILRQRVQQMKLASLGRLTASIAHEIRNPLGAISHAGQLLSESNEIDPENKRLTAIIDEHSKRVNNIIETIMNIGRREQTTPILIDMMIWLNEFNKEFQERHHLPENAIALDIRSNGIKARMDSTQLHQVLWNLCENGIRYSRHNPLITLKCAIKQDTERPYIDVIDNGTGINSDKEEQLFEPFFTTEARGTGLGLYIARELCEANQATLILYKNTAEGCCFRINFPHPDKMTW